MAYLSFPIATQLTDDAVNVQHRLALSLVTHHALIHTPPTSCPHSAGPQLHAPYASWGAYYSTRKCIMATFRTAIREFWEREPVIILSFVLGGLGK